VAGEPALHEAAVPGRLLAVGLGREQPPRHDHRLDQRIEEGEPAEVAPALEIDTQRGWADVLLLFRRHLRLASVPVARRSKPCKSKTQRLSSGVDVGFRLSPASPVLRSSDYSHLRQNPPNAAKIHVFSHRTVKSASSTSHAA